MNIHEQARLTPIRREEKALLVLSGQRSQAEAGRRFDVSIRTVTRWIERHRQAGASAMVDVNGGAKAGHWARR